MKLTSILFLAACVVVSVSAAPCKKHHHGKKGVCKHDCSNDSSVDNSNEEYHINKEDNRSKVTNIAKTDNSQDKSTKDSYNKTIVQKFEPDSGSTKKSGGLVNLNLLTSNKVTNSQSATMG